MTDIAERLRGFEHTEMPVEALAVVLEAADEIERLRGDIETLQAELRYERHARRALEPKP